MSDSIYRRARVEDVPRIVELLARLYANTKAYPIAYDEDSAIRAVNNVVCRGICLVGAKSCAGAMIQSWPFNMRVNVAELVFWNFTRPREITILEALASECHAAGADYFVATSHPPDNVIAKRYTKLGFKPVESHYLAALPILSLARNAKRQVES